MAQRKSNRGVTFVNVEGEKKAAKRKKKHSGDQGQSASKKQCLEKGESKTVKVPKEKVQKPISPDVLQHIESLMNTAELSVLSGKRIVHFENVQAELSSLKKIYPPGICLPSVSAMINKITMWLLQHIKKLKFPTTQVESLKILRKDLVEEKRKLEHNQEILESLNSEVEKAVEDSYIITESTNVLEEKLESLTQQAAADAETLDTATNPDPLQLPKATFEAATLQEKVRKLKNPNAVLRQLALVEKNPAYRGMRKLIEKAFNEISSSSS